MKYAAIILCLFAIVSCGGVKESPKSVTTLDMKNVESKELQKEIETINANTSLTVEEKVKQIKTLIEQDKKDEEEKKTDTIEE